MARYTGPKTKISRRFGIPIFGPSKYLERRNYGPGMHGPRSRRKNTEYALGLMEKQKFRYFYGLQEKQFRAIYETARRRKGVTGENMLQILETRLDNLVYQLDSHPVVQLLGNGGAWPYSGEWKEGRHLQLRCADQRRYRSEELKCLTSVGQQKSRTLHQSSSPEWVHLDKDFFKGVLMRLPSA